MCMWKCTSWKDVINTELLNHPHSGNKIPLREFKDCKSTHVIYKLSCPCGLLYIGQSKQPLKQQISEYKIKSAKTCPLHYISVGLKAGGVC